MGQLVHQDQVRLARQHGLHVELREGDAPVGRLTGGDDLELPELCPRLATTVALHPTDDDVVPGGSTSLTVGQHAVRLADSGG